MLITFERTPQPPPFIIVKLSLLLQDQIEPNLKHLMLHDNLSMPQ